jgi:hypothetical protein
VKTLTVKQDKDTGECYLDLESFKDLLDISKVNAFSLEEVNDDGSAALILKFYDKDGNVIDCKNKTDLKV